MFKILHCSSYGKSSQQHMHHIYPCKLQDLAALGEPWGTVLGMPFKWSWGFLEQRFSTFFILNPLPAYHKSFMAHLYHNYPAPQPCPHGPGCSRQGLVVGSSRTPLTRAAVVQSLTGPTQLLPMPRQAGWTPWNLLMAYRGVTDPRWRATVLENPHMAEERVAESWKTALHLEAHQKAQDLKLPDAAGKRKEQPQMGSCDPATTSLKASGDIAVHEYKFISSGHIFWACMNHRTVPYLMHS